MMQQNPYQMTEAELLSQLGSHEESGLTNQEYQQKRQEFGPNKLAEGKKKTKLQQFLHQFKDVMILILLLAAGISFFIALMEKEGYFVCI